MPITFKGLPPVGAGRSTCVGILIVMAGFGAPQLHAREPGRQTVLTIGRATDAPIKYLRRLQPIASYLASRLGDVGIASGKVLLAADNKAGTIVGYLKQKKLDLVIETPFQIAIYMERAGAMPIMTATRDGSRYYRTYLFVRKDSGVAGIEDLRGRIMAFEDPGSTSSFLLPMAEMKLMGNELIKLDSYNAAVPRNRIGYVFAGSELNISTWVYFGRIAAGVLNNIDWNKPAKLPVRYRQQLRIIYKTRKVPRMLVSARSGLDKRLLQRITQVLTRMHTTREGKAALKLYKVNRFEALPDSPRRFLSPIFELMKAARPESGG